MIWVERQGRLWIGIVKKHRLGKTADRLTDCPNATTDCMRKFEHDPREFCPVEPDDKEPLSHLGYTKIASIQSPFEYPKTSFGE
jgi:hypothetical protein